MLIGKRLLTVFITLVMVISLFCASSVNASTAPKFVVLQDFENISAKDVFSGHEIFGGSSLTTAEIASDYKVDGSKSLKLTSNPGAWEYKFIKLDMSHIDPTKMSAIIMYLKFDDTCTQDGGKQMVAKFGVWTSDKNAYFSNDLGRIFDVQTNEFLPADYSFGNKNTIWYSDARKKEIAVKIPTKGMLKNPDAPPGQPDLDYTKITHVFMCTHEPASGKSLYIDRIVGIEGEDDGSVGFAPEVKVAGAPSVVPELYMLQNFDSYAADTDLLASQVVLSTPRKGSWKQKEDGSWYFDGTIGTGKASDTFKGRGGMSAKFEYPEGMLAWNEGESAFKAPVQQYGPVNNMSGAIMYVKMPSKPTGATTDLAAFKAGFEGPKGSNYLVFGLKDGVYTKILNAGEDKWRYTLVKNSSIYLPYDWEGYVQIPYSYLTVTYPSPAPEASPKDSDFSPIIYGYVEAVGGECGAFYIDDLMVYTPSFDANSTAFIPSDWKSRKGNVAGTINLPDLNKVSIEDTLYDINNTDKKEITITLSNPVKISKDILAALKGKNKTLAMQVMNAENVLYTWKINGEDLSDISKDFEMNILINGSYYQDKMMDITKFNANDTYFITTVEENLPGKMELSVFTDKLFQSKANVYYFDSYEEKVYSVSKDVKVENGCVSFEVTKGGEYFISAGNYEAKEVSDENNVTTGDSNAANGSAAEKDNPDTGDKNGSIFVVFLGASLLSLIVLKKYFLEKSVYNETM